MRNGFREKSKRGKVCVCVARMTQEASNYHAGSIHQGKCQMLVCEPQFPNFEAFIIVVGRNASYTLIKKPSVGNPTSESWINCFTMFW